MGLHPRRAFIARWEGVRGVMRSFCCRKDQAYAMCAMATSERASYARRLDTGSVSVEDSTHGNQTSNWNSCCFYSAALCVPVLVAGTGSE